MLRFDGAVAPRVGGVFLLGPNTASGVDSPLLAGGAAVAGVDFRVPETPVSIRIGADVGVLGAVGSEQRPTFLLRGLAGIALDL